MASLRVKYADRETIIKFWEDPSTTELVKNAIPIECLLEQKSEVFSTSSHQYGRFQRDAPTLGPAIHTFPAIAQGGPPPPEPAIHTFPVAAQGGPPPPSESSESEASCRVLNDQDLETYPQNCVGKLFWVKKRGETAPPILYYCTGFYVGQSRVVTVAHVLFAVKESKNTEFEMGIFVPAMIDNDDRFGRLYGYYPIELDQNASQCSHSLYEPPQEIDYGGAPLWMPTKTPEYDVAAMILKKGCKHNNEQMEDVCIDEVLQRPILCIPPTNDRCGDLATWWGIYGYGKKESGGIPDDGSDGSKMTMVICRNMPNDTLLLKTTGAVVRKGMSGGPWMPLPISGEANGCQNQAVNENLLVSGRASAQGPRFTKELLIDLEIEQ